MLRFLILFLLIQMSLFGLELWQPVHPGGHRSFTALIAHVSATLPYGVRPRRDLAA